MIAYQKNSHKEQFFHIQRKNVFWKWKKLSNNAMISLDRKPEKRGA